MSIFDNAMDQVKNLEKLLEASKKRMEEAHILISGLDSSVVKDKLKEVQKEVSKAVSEGDKGKVLEIQSSFNAWIKTLNPEDLK